MLWCRYWLHPHRLASVPFQQPVGQPAGSNTGACAINVTAQGQFKNMHNCVLCLKLNHTCQSIC